MRNEYLSRIVDLNAVIAEMARLLHLIGGDNPVARTALNRGLGRIQADPRLIDWILVSLAIRALSAMAEGSELVITTANEDLDGAASGKMNVPPGAFVQVEFTTAGAGMEVPSTVRQIVQREHGAISTRSEAGHSTVTVLFPRMAEETCPEPAPADRKLFGPMILLVDDYLGAGDLTREWLEEAGYLVLQAAGREEAEVVLAACQVDLIIAVGAQRISLLKDHPEINTISAGNATKNALLETVRREVDEPSS